MSKDKKKPKRNRILLPLIIIFSGFVLYDSKRMRLRAQRCNHPYDFIDNLLKLFLNFVNLWRDTMAIGVSNQ